MIRGNKIYLCAIEKEDLPELMKWRNEESFRKHFREYREINKTMQEKWYNEKVINDCNTIMFSVKSCLDDELLGCCGLCYINWINRNADLSLYIGWNEEYIDDIGYAKEACELLLYYGFNQLGLNKIWTEIYEFDIKKKKLYDKLGLNVDGVLRENCFYDGKWWNSYILSILRDEFLSKKG